MSWASWPDQPGSQTKGRWADMTKSRRFDEFKRKPYRGSWRAKTHEIIFEADTPAGKAFDIALIVSIVLSVAAVMLDSVGAISSVHGRLLSRVEWLFTLLFTIEYLLRLLCIGRCVQRFDTVQFVFSEKARNGFHIDLVSVFL